MPRTGGGVYVKPFPDVTSGTTIASAVHNGIVSDVETDLNAPRPIIAGGTGATTAAIARTNLGAETALQTITNFDAAVWQPGSFYAASGATAGPPSGGTTSEHFYGTFYGDTVNGFVEARGLTNGLNYVRRKTGTWSAWALDGSDKLSNTGGTITGPLTVNSTLNVTGTTTLGTLNAGAGTFSSLVVTPGTTSINALSTSSITTNGNTITAGAINGSTLTLSGLATINGSIATNAISCSTLNTNGNTLTTGTINAGVLNTTGINATGDIHTYRAGATNTGVIYLDSANTHYLFFDGTNYQLPSGSLSVGGNVTAGTFNGALNGNASTANYATTAGSLSGGGSITIGDGGNIEGPYFIDLKYPGHSGEDYDGRIIAGNDHSLHISAANGIYLDIGTSVTGGMSAHGYRQRQGISGGYSSNGSHQWFNICIANSGAAFEFWSNDTNYGSIFMSCDYRIKKDVAPLPSTWAQVKALKPISYTFNNYNGAIPDGVQRWGFIAHELQETLIESAASGHKDQAGVVQTPTPITLIAALTKALQEAMARIEALEAAG